MSKRDRKFVWLTYAITPRMRASTALASLLVSCSSAPTGSSGTPMTAAPTAGVARAGAAGVTAGPGAGTVGAVSGRPGAAPVGVAAAAAGVAGAAAGVAGAAAGVAAVGGAAAMRASPGTNATDEDAGVGPMHDAGALPSAGKGAAGNGAAGMAAAGSGGSAPTCNKIPEPSTDCQKPLSPGDARKCALSVALRQRSYYLYAPKTYNPCEPTALIIDCHGAMETAEAQAGIDTLHVAQTTNGPLEYPGIGSGWRLEADTPGGGFIVVTPQGLDNVWTSLNNDPQFFLDIVTATKKIANIAPDKVYMSGISNGSLISFETACAHTDVFSGIAAFSAGQDCSSVGKPIPVIAFDAMPDFAYDTTVSAIDTMVQLDQCKAAVQPKWLTIDSSTTDTICRNDPFDKHPSLVPCNTIMKTSITTMGIEPTVCKRWDGCSSGVGVVFCDVAPSTLHGPDNAAVDAHILYGNASSLNMPSVAWRFFKSFWK